MWRKTDDRKVWYEWLVDIYAYLPPSPQSQADDGGKGKGRAAPPIVTGLTGVRKPEAGSTIAEPIRKGKKIRVGGSELHSSVKEACLM